MTTTHQSRLPDPRKLIPKAEEISRPEPATLGCSKTSNTDTSNVARMPRVGVHMLDCSYLGLSFVKQSTKVLLCC